MKFSVIIPLYNKASYIRKALESVLAQTYTDWECIVVDDGSMDGSAEIAEQLLASPKSFHEGKDLNTEENFPSLQGGDRGRLIRQTNSGVSAARNNGVAQASGEYVAFLDADDWWEPTYLERMAQLIEDYPDAGLYACNYYYYKDGKKIVKVRGVATGYINYPKTYFETLAMPVTSITAIVPRCVFDAIGGFPLGMRLGEDFYVWAKIALSHRVAYLNELLAYYNNTVPVSKRATRNLHAPEYNVLFHLQDIFGDSLDKSEVESPKDDLKPTKNDWCRLIDMLRLFGLHSYWLSNEYYLIAQQELDKVDVTKQRDSLVNLYKMPRWIQRVKQVIMRVGSAVKQALIK